MYLPIEAIKGFPIGCTKEFVRIGEDCRVRAV